MKKKTIVLILTVVMLFGTAVGGTLAYLTSVKTVTNTFTVGKVEIKLNETAVDETGTPVAGADRVSGNEYHLIPGQTYIKDPTVTVMAKSEEAYIRMLVTITDLADVKAAFGIADGEYFLPQYFVNGWDPAIWETTGVVVEDTTKDTAVYEFRYYKTVANTGDTDVSLEPLFTDFTVPGEMDNAAIGKLAEMQIIVEGHAVQAAGFTAEDMAWLAFDKQVKTNTP